jgi:ribosomal protein S18 acetylase RimI-like enzyme
MVQTDSHLPSQPASAEPPVQIRPANLHDVDRLTDVLTASFYDADGWRQLVYPFIRLGIQEDLRQRLRANSPRYTCLAALLTSAGEANLAGTIEIALRSPWPWQGDRHGYISNLAVGQGFRRRGVATALLKSCEQVARQWQIEELRLHVMEDNPAARALYRDAGFSTLQAEDSPASWLGLQARRLLLRKIILPLPAGLQ